MSRFVLLLAPLALFAQAPDPITQVYNGNVGMIESEVVSLVEAMPEDKFNFVPTNGAFKTSRTFAQQATHIAAVNYATCSAVLGEKNPVDMGGKAENGPATIKTKAEVLKFLKDSFAYAHKAMATVNSKSIADPVDSAFQPGKKVPRANMASVPVWHGFDHYGQMVIYARMNNIVPPASR